MNIPYIMRKCTCCEKWLVASTVNFHRHKSSKYGLESQCKKCRNKKNKQWQEANKNKRLEYYKQYHEANRDKRLEYNKQWHKANREKELEYKKQYYEANRDKILEHAKQYYQSPQGQVVAFNRNQKRRTREERQGSGITKDQWLEMMKFFNWRCAYSGEYLGGEDNLNRTIDHIIPISKNGPHEIWNLVPMARSLNCSKNNKNMLTWYKSQECFNRERLDKIYQWQEYAFNKYYLEGEE